jgi:7-carboxy-7-deazaguanine synthase
MHLPNIDLLRPQDVLKLVIGSTEDFTRSLEIIRERHSESYIYLSAVFGRVEPMEIVEKLLAWSKEISTEKIRVQLQLHKYIWNPEMRGV